jgi:uncharacterized protein (TIGR00255 family)
MLLSMTGYGRETQTFRDKTINVEIRSLNSKFSDLRLKIPQNYKEKEHEIRRIISDKTQRGKIDVLIETSSLQGDEEFGLNKALFRKYFDELNALTLELGAPREELTAAILRLPNVVATDAKSIHEEEWNFVLSIIDEALNKFRQFRLTEGAVLEDDLKTRTNNIMELLEKVDPYEKERIEKIRKRLRQNLDDFFGKENVDENRFEQEVIFYIEKIDITEEKVRLAQHCKYFLEELDKKNTGKGRKLSFISQEMGREINTLGAKAYSSDIQRYVVSMKDELEKIKEQVLNAV